MNIFVEHILFGTNYSISLGPPSSNLVRTRFQDDEQIRKTIDFLLSGHRWEACDLPSLISLNMSPVGHATCTMIIVHVSCPAWLMCDTIHVGGSRGRRPLGNQGGFGAARLRLAAVPSSPQYYLCNTRRFPSSIFLLNGSKDLLTSCRHIRSVKMK